MPPERCATDAAGTTRLDLELAHGAKRGALLLLAADEAVPREEPEIADRDVAANRQVEEEADALAIFGEQRDAGTPRIAGEAIAISPAVDLDLARGGRRP